MSGGYGGIPESGGGGGMGGVVVGAAEVNWRPHSPESQVLRPHGTKCRLHPDDDNDRVLSLGENDNNGQQLLGELFSAVTGC